LVIAAQVDPISTLVCNLYYCNRCGNPLATMVVQPFLPPHSANRHDADGVGAGGHRLCGNEMIPTYLLMAEHGGMKTIGTTFLAVAGAIMS
jgi:hypothetical protein